MTIYERFPMSNQEGEFIVSVAYPHDYETLKTLEMPLQKTS